MLKTVIKNSQSPLPLFDEIEHQVAETLTMKGIQNSKNQCVFILYHRNISRLKPPIHLIRSGILLILEVEKEWSKEHYFKKFQKWFKMLFCVHHY